jgi:serine/threonine protein kinase
MDLDSELVAGPVANHDDLPPPPSRPPPVVAGYDLLGEIGRGGMGVVYRARHNRLGRVVALKLLRAGALAGPEERERFLREARAVARLQHPHIVQVYDVGEHAGGPYLALELVPGGSLARRLADRPLPPRAAAELVATLAEAVQYAHSQGVVHRDLKPANILLSLVPCPLSLAQKRVPSEGLQGTTDKGQGTIPKITDFGLARSLADDPGTTASGAVIGTPSYMAPEQAAGARAVTPAADIYALGAILYECLTGRPPFRAATVLETLDQVRSADPVAPARLQPAVARDLNTVCLKCLEKEPAKRFGTAQDLADDLRRFLAGEPVLARPVGVWGRTWRWCRRNPRVASLLVALAVALTAGFAGVFVQWRRAERLYTLAETRRTTAENNLRRYEQAADDFAGLIDTLETDQLFHLRTDSLRRELVVPALRRNQEFLASHGADPARRAEAARAHFRVAVLTRLLSNDAEPATRHTALAAGRRALAELESFAAAHPGVVEYRRDRAALVQNLGYLLHATGQSAEGITVLEDACRQRQALLDAQPDHLDYRSELASCWNDLGLALDGAGQYDEAAAAQERAAGLQRVAFQAAPQVSRYRRQLCNHLFNRAMSLTRSGRTTEAAAAAGEGRHVAPEDPGQWFREARILALLAARTGSPGYEDQALAALRQAIGRGFDNHFAFTSPDFSDLHERPEFGLLLREFERRRKGRAPTEGGSMSQAP